VVLDEQNAAPMIRTRSDCAEVAELADAPDSGSGARKGVEVQVLSSALQLIFSIAAFTVDDCKLALDLRMKI
jgi:hypothetical protein